MKHPKLAHKEVKALVKYGAFFLGCIVVPIIWSYAWLATWLEQDEHKTRKHS